MDFEELSKAKDALIDAVGASLRHFDSAPEVLYHFTDADGLKGILQSKTIWLTCATALNDSSEMLYGRGVAAQVLSEGPPESAEFREHAARFLGAPDLLDGFDFESFPHVASFCESADDSFHWLHYGRSGAGCAIEVRADQLSVGGAAELRRVLYRTDEQQALFARVLTAGWSRLCELERPTAGRGSLGKLAAHITANYLNLACSWCKNPSFANEQEWRLVSFDSIPDVDVAKHGGLNVPTQFRTVGGRLAAYIAVPYGRLPITAVLLGAASPIEEADDSLRLLLDRTGFRGLPVRRSNVPVRP